MISTVTLTLDLTASPPKGIVTDLTDYSALGIDLLATQAKGLGQITFNGDIIVPNGGIADPMIDLEFLGSNPQVFQFDLELDLNGEVANGVYTLEYSLRLASDFSIVEDLESNVIVVGATDAWLANYLEAGNTITLTGGASPTQNVTVVSAVFNDPNITITVAETITADTFTGIEFDIVPGNVQLDASYSYAGCTRTTANVSFTYDCEYGDNGSWAVANTTVLAANEIVSSLNCTINYPSWTTLDPNFPGNVVVNSLPYPTIQNSTPLATGTYSVSLSEQIHQIQTDGLILQYSTSTIEEYPVSCAGSLCGLTPCIENLRVAHANELQRNRISKYQVFVDNVLLYYAEAQNYRTCGDTANYRATLELIKQNLDSSGCECACCDDNLYYWVSNNSAVSVIDSLLQSFQFRLNSGVPDNNDDVSAGVQVGAIWQDVTTGYLWRCTVATEGEAEWEQYYTPGGAPEAVDIPANGGSHAILTGPNVQVQLDQADLALENIQIDAIYDGINGLTKTGNNLGLGGSLDAATTIDTQSFTFRLNSEGDTNRFALLGGTNQVQFGQYGGNLFPGTTATYGLGVVADGKVVETDLMNTASNGLTKVGKDVQLGGDQTGDVVIDKQGFTFKINSEGDDARFAVLDSSNQIQFGQYGGGVFPATTATYGLAVQADGKVVETTLPKVYVALLTQIGTGNPTATVISNTTGQTLTWDRVGTGYYRCLATGTPFTTGKSIVTVCYGAGGLDYPGGIQAYVNTTNSLFLLTTGLGPTGVGPAAYTDGMLTFATVKIEIYP